MGFLKGLLGLGVTAGAAFAALKVAQKYEENKAADAAAAAAGAEPQDVPAGSVLEDIARAAGGVLQRRGRKGKRSGDRHCRESGRGYRGAERGAARRRRRAV